MTEAIEMVHDRQDISSILNWPKQPLGLGDALAGPRCKFWGRFTGKARRHGAELLRAGLIGLVNLYTYVLICM